MLLSLILFAAGPLDELAAARAVYPGLVKSEQSDGIVIVSFLGSQGNIDDTRFMLDTALNHSVRRVQLQRVRRVVGQPRETLWFIDFNELGWKADGVKRLLAQETYFRTVAADAQDHYDVPLVRADWLARVITFGKTYYDLAFDNPKTLGDIFKTLGFDAKSAAVDIVKHGARVTESRVSVIGYRVIVFLGNSPSGPVWISFDVKRVNGKKPREFIREKFELRDFKNPDAHEVIFVLPNGLLGYAVTDGKENLVEVAADDVAIDTRDFRAADQLKDIVNERPNRNRTVIENPHVCMTCHATGMQPAPDWVAPAIRTKALDITGYDKPTKRKIEDFFSERHQAREMDHTSSRCTAQIGEIQPGQPALKTMTKFAIMRWRYNDAPVTRAQAARELDVTEDEFLRFATAVKATTTDDSGYQLRLNIAYWLLGVGKNDSARAVLGYNDDEFKDFLAGKVVLPLGSNSLNALAVGQSISRDEWESQIYIEAALLICYEKRKLTAATIDMVRERFKPSAPPQQQQPVKIAYDQPQPQFNTDARTGRPIKSADGGKTWEFVTP